MSEQFIGVDIGGTSSTVGLVANGKVLERTVVNMAGQNDPERFAEELVQAINSFGSNNIKAIGIGAPNGNFLTGCIESAPNLHFKGNAPLANLVAEKSKLSTFLTNDANAAALGEKRYGCAKEFNDFLLITLGTGLGSGIFANSQLVYGHTGMAGEIGHTIVQHRGRPCSCGREGCLETYVSIRGMERTARKLAHEQDNFEWIQKGSIDPSDIQKAAEAGDQLALQVYDRTAMLLALGLSNSIAHLGSEAIVFFGGIATAGDLLFDPFKKHFEELLLFNFHGKVKVLLSALPQNDAAILVAAALAQHEHH